MSDLFRRGGSAAGGADESRGGKAGQENPTDSDSLRLVAGSGWLCAPIIWARQLGDEVKRAFVRVTIFQFPLAGRSEAQMVWAAHVALRRDDMRGGNGLNRRSIIWVRQPCNPAPKASFLRIAFRTLWNRPN